MTAFSLMPAERISSARGSRTASIVLSIKSSVSSAYVFISTAIPVEQNPFRQPQGQADFHVSSSIHSNKAKRIAQNWLIAGQHHHILWQATYQGVKVFTPFGKHIYNALFTRIVHCFSSIRFNRFFISRSCVAVHETRFSDPCV